MLAIIAARSGNNVIGKNGTIPWNLKGEQLQFKTLTTGQTVIMGRRSYEEIGHPLPNRQTIVVSGTKCFTGENLQTAHTLQEALALAKTDEIYIAGGSALFREALPLADVIYLTEVDLTVEDGDTFFPDFDRSAFECTIGETLGDTVKYTRTTYTRRHPE